VADREAFRKYTLFQMGRETETTTRRTVAARRRKSPKR
jgi:hypothetical protein